MENKRQYVQEFKETLVSKDGRVFIIKEAICNVSLSEVKQALDMIQAVCDENGYRNVQMVMEYYYDYAELGLFYERPETDKEYKDRIAKQEAKKKRKEAAEKREKAQYERLKKKYGDV